MFNHFSRKPIKPATVNGASPFNIQDDPSPFVAEALESRRMLSVAHAFYHGPISGDPPFRGHGRNVSEIPFNLTPAAVQTGLNNLASTDGDTAPTSTTEVYLGNRNGVETYSIFQSSTGTSSTLTVDASGTAVTAPTRTTTTFGAITTAAVTNEFNAIATAIGATAPVSTTSVSVSTTSGGAATYTIGLATTNSRGRTHTTRYSVDSSGNPVGKERVPLSTLSTVIQNGLTAAAPTGATALTGTSLIRVSTVDGITLYSTTYKTTGTRTTVSVNSAGTLTSQPTTTTVDFSTLPAAAQSELQTLATAEGVSTAIGSTQSVRETTESNGTVLYTVTLTATSSTDATETNPITLTVDAAGNPTVTGGVFGGIFSGIFPSFGGGFFGHFR